MLDKKLSREAKIAIIFWMVVAALLACIITFDIVSETLHPRYARKPATISVYYYLENGSSDWGEKICEFTSDEREKSVDIPFFGDDRAYKLQVRIDGDNRTYSTYGIKVERGTYRKWGDRRYREFEELKETGIYTYFIYLQEDNALWVPFCADLTIRIV